MFRVARAGAELRDDLLPTRSHFLRVLDGTVYLRFQRGCATVPELSEIESAIEDRRRVDGALGSVYSDGVSQPVGAAFADIVTSHASDRVIV